MNDTATDQWADRTLTEAQRENRAMAEVIPVGQTGTTPQNFAQLVDYAKFMSTARGVVGAHLINNVGACLAVLEIANKFAMPGYMVASQTYAVDGKVAFMGQLIMAIINKHAPLEGRLRYRFDGQIGPKATSTRRVTVIGRFKGEAEDLTYECPEVCKLRVKNSPLWEEDQDQQLIYFASRRWQRRHWPEGLMGVYAPDELEERHIGADNARDVTPKTLAERLVDARVGDGGFQNGDAESQIAEMRDEAPAKVIDAEPAGAGAAEPTHATSEVGAATEATADPAAQTASAEASNEAFVQLTLSSINACTSKTALKEVWSKSKEGRARLSSSEEAVLAGAKAAKETMLTKGAR